MCRLIDKTKDISETRSLPVRGLWRDLLALHSGYTKLHPDDGRALLVLQHQVHELPLPQQTSRAQLVAIVNILKIRILVKRSLLQSSKL